MYVIEYTLIQSNSFTFTPNSSNNGVHSCQNISLSDTDQFTIKVW